MATDPDLSTGAQVDVLTRTATNPLPGVPIPVAVIGFGRMGRRHVETLTRSADFELVAVIDSDPAQVHAARALGLPASTRLANAFALTRAAVIATPTEMHASIFDALSNQGIDCMIEKPIGVNLAQLDEMGAIAKRNGTRIFAGYCERFHPAVLALRSSVGNAATRIEIRRTSVQSEDRRFDIDVMLDLLVHDLDWLYSIVKAEPLDARVESSCTPEHQLEEVTCLLHFPGGLQAHLTASRIAACRQRGVTVTHADGQLSIFNFDSTQILRGEDNLSVQAKAFATALRGLPSTIADLGDARRVMSLVERLRESNAPAPGNRTTPCPALHDG
jgi:predicted dehydrogenase